MKRLNQGFMRSLVALVLGIVLVMWPDVAVTYLVITIGLFFIVPGVIGLLAYFLREKKEGELAPMFPLEAAGSILFGIWLVVMPEFFVSMLMYLLGALLILAGAHQLTGLVLARKWTHIPWGFYLMPLLILASGILIVAYPFGAATNTFAIIGGTSICYGAIELVKSYKFSRQEK